MSDGAALTVLARTAVSANAVGTLTPPDAMTVGVGASQPAAWLTGGLQVGQAFGSRYHILRQLGAGGMGIVYQAWDAELGVAVALKVIRPDVLADPGVASDIERRFKRELVLARTVTHKNVVRIHDLGSIDGIKYLTMPFVEGETLAQILTRRGRLPVPEAIAIAKQVAHGLGAAGDVGVIHRDLKPENIMIAPDGTALIMDFGIARSAAGTGTATAMGAVVGTLEYMSPEQAQAHPLDQRTDLYSLGLIVYDILTGRQRIARHGSAMSEMMSRMQQAPPPLRQLDDQVPEALAQVVSRCLQPAVDARYPTTAALTADLEALSPDGHAMVRARPAGRRLALSPAFAAAVFGIAAIALAAGGWFAWRSRAAAPAAPIHPVSVLVANFENRAGDPLLDGLVEQAVSVGIEGASFISTYPRRDALRLVAEQNLGPTLTEQAARLIAIREGVNRVVSGSVAAPVGGRYELAVKILDPNDGKATLTWSTEAAGRGDVLNAVGRLAAKVRTALGDRAVGEAGLKNEETFTAASLEAAHAYVEGQELQTAGKYEQAIAAYERAVQLDPTLGRAYAGLGAVSGSLGRRQEAEKYYRQAIANIDRMTDRERYRTRAGYYLLGHDARKGADELEALARQFPADSSALSNLALVSFFRRDMAKAMDLGRRASAIYPKNVLRRNNVALYAMYAGDFDAARSEAETVLGLNPAFVKAHVAIALSNLAQGKPAEAEAAYRRLAAVSDTGSDFAAWGLADVAMYQGRTGEAAAALERALANRTPKRSTTTEARLLVTLAEARLEQGRAADAAKLAEEALAASVDAPILFLAGRVYLDAGRIPGGLDLAKQLALKLDDEPHVYARLLQGEADLRRGDPRSALAKFREAQDLSDTWLGRFGLGRAYLAAAGYLEAESEFERCLKRRGEATAAMLDDVPTYRWLPLVNYYRGLAQEGIKPGSGAESFRAFVAAKAQEAQSSQLTDARRRSGPTR